MIVQVARLMLAANSVAFAPPHADGPLRLPDLTQNESAPTNNAVPLNVSGRLTELFRDSLDLLVNGPGQIAGSHPSALEVFRYKLLSKSEFDGHVANLRTCIESDVGDKVTPPLTRDQLCATLEMNQAAIRSVAHFLNNVSYSREVAHESALIERRLGLTKTTDEELASLNKDRDAQRGVYEKLVQTARLNRDLYASLSQSELAPTCPTPQLSISPEVRNALIETCAILRKTTIDRAVADTLSLDTPLSLVELERIEEQLIDPGVSSIDSTLAKRITTQARHNINAVLGRAHGESQRVSILIDTLSAYHDCAEREVIRKELVLRMDQSDRARTEAARQAQRLDELQKVTAP